MLVKLNKLASWTLIRGGRLQCESKTHFLPSKTNPRQANSAWADGALVLVYVQQRVGRRGDCIYPARRFHMRSLQQSALRHRRYGSQFKSVERRLVFGRWSDVDDGDTFRAIPDPLQPRLRGFSSRIWVVGGYRFGSGLNDVWSSADGISWRLETASAAFSPRYQHTCVALNSRLWVIGGTDGNVHLNDVWSSANGVTWTRETAAAPFSGRAGHSCEALNGRLWVIGGQVAVNDDLKDIWSSADGINWRQETAAAAFSARGFHTSVILNFQFFVIGGTDPNNRWLNDVWSSADGVNWTTKTTAGGVSGARQSRERFPQRQDLGARGIWRKWLDE